MVPLQNHSQGGLKLLTIGEVVPYMVPVSCIVPLQICHLGVPYIYGTGTKFGTGTIYCMVPEFMVPVRVPKFDTYFHSPTYLYICFIKNLADT